MITQFCDICIEKGKYKKGIEFFLTGLCPRKTGYICNECKQEQNKSSQPERSKREDTSNSDAVL